MALLCQCDRCGTEILAVEYDPAAASFRASLTPTGWADIAIRRGEWGADTRTGWLTLCPECMERLDLFLARQKAEVAS